MDSQIHSGFMLNGYRPLLDKPILIYTRTLDDSPIYPFTTTKSGYNLSLLFIYTFSHLILLPLTREQPPSRH